MITQIAPAWIALLVFICQGGPSKLDDARKKLQGNTEGIVRSGAQDCLAANSPEAAELLLKTLAGIQPHYRDIAFEFLEKFTDPYAIKLVENACTTHKDEQVRAWCADLLGAYAGKATIEPLVRALSESNTDIKSSAVRALGRLRVREGGTRASALKSHADPLVRANAVIAAALCDPKQFGKLVLSSLSDRDAGVRAALLEVLPAVVPESVGAASKSKITDPDWRPRLQATRNLCNIRDRDSLAALVLASGDARRVVREAAMAGLIQMTGKKFTNGAAWKAWFEGEGASFVIPAAPSAAKDGAAAPADTGVFFGLPIDSDHTAFFIDCGQTMSGNAPSGAGTKMEQVISELAATLKSLPAGVKFNVYAYATKVTPWKDKAQLLNDASIKAALDFLKSQKPAGNKDIYEAVRTALSDPDIDTVYLMSDGEPEVGLYVHYNRVVDHLSRRNILRKMVFHTVHIADPSWNAATTEWYRSQLREIAKATGGKYIEK